MPPVKVNSGNEGMMASLPISVNLRGNEAAGTGSLQRAQSKLIMWSKSKGKQFN